MDGRWALTVAVLVLLASPAAALVGAAEAPRAASRATLLDIVAVDLSGPANSTLGDQVLLTSRVANIGQERANNTTIELSWRLSGSGDPLVPFALYDFLAEGVSTNVTEPPVTWEYAWDTGVSGPPGAGTYDLVLTAADALDVNNANNTYQTTIEFFAAPPPPVPHLAIVDPLELPSLWFLDDGNLTEGIRVTNNGTGPIDAVAPAILQLRTDDVDATLVWEHTIADLKVGKSANIAVDFDPTVIGADVTVAFVLSLVNGTDPLNQTQTTGEVTLLWRTPDLGLRLLVVLPLQPVATDTLTARVQVLNNGTLAVALRPVRLLVDGTEVAVAEVNVSDGGGATTLDLFWPTSEADVGSHGMTVTVDGAPVTLQWTVSLGPRPRPNLYLATLTIPALARSEEPGQELPLAIAAALFNNGTAAAANVSVALLVDGTEVDRATNVSVPRGSSTSLSFAATFISAEDDTTHVVEARVLTFADPLGGSVLREVTVPGDEDQPIVGLVDFVVGQSTQEQARPVFMNVTLRNTGDASDVVGVIVTSAIVGGKGIATVASSSVTLPPGSTVIEPVVWNVSATEGVGDHSLTVAVEGQSLSRTVAITALKVPELWIKFEQESFYATRSAGREQEFTITLIVRNVGETDTGKVSVRVYNDLGEEVCTRSIPTIAPEKEEKVSCPLQLRSVKPRAIAHYSATAETVAEFAGENVVGLTSRSFAALVEPPPPTPGFEALAAIAAVAVALLVLRRRRR